MSEKQLTQKRRKPDWLKIKVPLGKNYVHVHQVIEDAGLHTICTSGKCPNMAECWGAGTATLMILGDICTRACRFCAVKTGRPNAVDTNEPKRVAESIKKMNLKHVVLTSVDRDDLEDGGATIWAQTITQIKAMNPEITIETLIPDFDAREELLDIVIAAKPEIISHNMETVQRLTAKVRSRSRYDRSLQVLQYLASKDVRTKSGIMLGLGETEQEILQTMDDLLAVDCKIMTIGQYLQPTKNHLEVQEYVTPEKFAEYKKIGLQKGFEFVESSPLVRSSYHAEKHLKKN